jgi:PAS domain S-box-containing protein
MSINIALPSASSWPQRVMSAAQMPVIVALAYYVGAEAAFAVGTLSDKIFAPFWPPNIVLLCALLLSPPRRWWLCVLATFPPHVIAELGVGMPIPQLLVAFATNCAVALLNAIAVLYVSNGPPWLDDLRKTSFYLFISAIVSPALVALGGAFVPILGGGPLENYWAFWAQWYLANALAAVTLGPAALAWLGEFRKSIPAFASERLVEALALSAALAFVCAVAFEVNTGRITSGFLPAVLYLPLPLILWAAVRFGVKGVSAAILIVTVVLIWRTLNGPSMFLAGDAETNVIAIQTFLIGLAIPMLLLGAAIDERRHAEQAVRDSEERMTFAAQSASIGLWHFRRDGNQVWMTEHGRAMFGFPKGADVTRQALINAIHPEDRQAALDGLRSAVAGELVNVAFRVVQPDGKLRWLRARARTHRNSQGEAIEFSGTFADVTDLKTAEEAAASQRQEIAHLMRVSTLGELSGGIAHELTQPLTAIVTNAQAARLLMEHEGQNLGEIASTLDDIIGEGHRAGEVIHRMRGLLKKGEGKFEPVDLNELITSTLKLVRSELIGRQVSASTDLAGGLPMVSGDPVQLQQVLLNLVMNAADAMSALPSQHRRIVIRTRPTLDADIQVSVVDQGSGLGPVQQERVFQAFFSTKERGLGLGLSISASIIKSHGGTLTLENNSHRGATATFRLHIVNATADV